MNLQLRSNKFLAVVVLLPMSLPFWVEVMFRFVPHGMTPQWWVALCWAFCALPIIFLRNPLNILMAAALMLMPFFGVLNSVMAYVRYGHHFLVNINEAQLIYIIYAFVYLFGLFCSERFFVKEVTPNVPFALVKGRTGEWLFIVLVGLFPLAYFVDQVIALGTIPIFSGRGIEDDMYSLGYGKLHAYGVLGCLSLPLLYVVYRFKPPSSNWLIFVVLCGLLSSIMLVVDGRRVVLLLALVALVGMLLGREQFEFSRTAKRIAALGVLGYASYISLLVLRKGGQLSGSDDWTSWLIVGGVEFRDFAYVIQQYGVGGLRNYDWAISFIGSFLHWLLVAIFFGASKGDLVGAGSAYQIAIAEKSAFGIRIGLVGELHLDYGYLGLVPLFLIAIIHGWVAWRLRATGNLVNSLFLSAIYSIFVLALVGQSTAAGGYLSVLMYAYILYRLLRLLFDRQYFSGDGNSR